MVINRELLYTIFDLQELLPRNRFHGKKLLSENNACKIAKCSRSSLNRLYHGYIEANRHPQIKTSTEESTIINAVICNPCHDKLSLKRDLNNTYDEGTIYFFLKKHGISRLPDRLISSYLLKTNPAQQSIFSILNHRKKYANLRIIRPDQIEELHIKKFMNAILNSNNINTTGFQGRGNILKFPITYPGCITYFTIRKVLQFKEQTLELSIVDHLTGLASCRLYLYNKEKNLNEILKTYLNSLGEKASMMFAEDICQGLFLVDQTEEIPDLNKFMFNEIGKKWSAIQKLLTHIPNISIDEKPLTSFHHKLDYCFYPAFVNCTTATIAQIQILLARFLDRYNNAPSELPYTLGKSPEMMWTVTEHLVP